MSVSTAPAETSLADRWAASCHDVVALVGRVLMSWIFVASGFGKITAVTGFAAVLAKRGVPAPTFMGWLGAIVEFGGGLLLLLGVKTRYTAILMILFVIVATLISRRSGTTRRSSSRHNIRISGRTSPSSAVCCSCSSPAPAATA